MARGIRGFTLEILPRNARMLKLAANALGSMAIIQEDGEVHMTVVFRTET